MSRFTTSPTGSPPRNPNCHCSMCLRNSTNLCRRPTAMPRKIVLVSGNVASGKTTLVERLKQEFDHVHVVKTKEVIRELAAKKLRRDLEPERRAMQQFGDRLDRETKGQWVRDALRRMLSQLG